jgi:hypothetical protein
VGSNQDLALQKNPKKKVLLFSLCAPSMSSDCCLMMPTVLFCGVCYAVTDTLLVEVLHGCLLLLASCNRWRNQQVAVVLHNLKPPVAGISAARCVLLLAQHLHSIGPAKPLLQCSGWQQVVKQQMHRHFVYDNVWL